MTEERWLRRGNWVAMLEFVLATASDRKLRLFGCACARLLPASILATGLERAVAASEAFADGEATAAALQRAGSHPGRAGRWSVASHDARWLARSQGEDPSIPRDKGQRRRGLLHCLFGNPFRPLSPRALPPHVVGLARSIYAAFPEVSPDYAVLADALEELGEADAAAHCRLELHARGCHVLDWITGRA
jgi:hypothetical protein